MFHRYQAHIYPLTSLIFYLICHNKFFHSLKFWKFDIKYWTLAIVIGGVLSFLMLFVEKTEFKAQPRKTLMVVSIIMGIVWLELLVNTVVDIVQFVRVITGTTEIFMGLTILAIANTFVDLFVNGSLAAQGYEIMAITGLFGGQMFNFLIGFALSGFVKYFGHSKFKTFNLYTYGTMSQDKEGRMTFYMLLWIIAYLGFLGYLLVKNQ